MPRSAPMPCVEPGCALLQDPLYHSRCSKHGPKHAAQVKAKARKQRRGKPHHREKMSEEDRKLNDFYGGRWKAVSAAYRRRHPLCAHCEADGCITPAVCVDHIVERRDGGANYDHSNLQSLCQRCHNRKTLQEKAKRLSKLPGAW